MPTTKPTPAAGPGVLKVRLLLELSIPIEPAPLPVLAELPDGSQVLDLSAYRARRDVRAA